MPSVPAPNNPNEIIPAPSAALLFQQIRDDQPLSVNRAYSAPLPPVAAPLPGLPALLGLPALSGATGSAPRAATGTTAPSCIVTATKDTTDFGTPAEAFAENPAVPNAAP